MTGSSKWSTWSSSDRSCSSQWLFATQIAQMWLRSRNNISVIVRRYSVSCSDVVVTSIPSTTAVVHAGVSLFEPATWTTHSRHEPVSERPSRWHIVGMSMPFSVATDRIDWRSVPAMSALLIRSVCTFTPVLPFLLILLPRTHPPNKPNQQYKHILITKVTQ